MKNKAEALKALDELAQAQHAAHPASVASVVGVVLSKVDFDKLLDVIRYALANLPVKKTTP